jgi:type I restriction enzyme R subunit
MIIRQFTVTKIYVTDENFLVDILKFKSDRARTALVKNRAKLVIKELASHNPVYYERLRERLEKIIREEEQRRKQNANYFNNYKEILQEALEEDKERKKLGFSNLFEFAVYEELLEVFKDKKIAMGVTRKVSSMVNDEIQIVGWKTKTSSDKKMSIAIYDILNENKIPESKVDGLTSQIIELAKRNL